MQEFKRSHFKAERPHEAFPDISPLSSSAAASLRRRVARALGISEQVDGLGLSCQISAAATLVPGVNAENSDFRVSRVLLNEGITPEDFVFLDWYRFTEVDQIRFDDLEAYFDFIWYQQLMICSFLMALSHGFSRSDMKAS